MATLIKTPSRNWKAVVRKRGWPTTARTFRLKRDAADWARHLEDHIVSGDALPQPRSRLLFGQAIERYLREVSAIKSPKTYQAERGRAKHLLGFFEKYFLTSITPDLVATYRDMRLVSRHRNVITHRSPEALLAPPTVRLELALLSHLYVVAIREWRTGQIFNPVSLVRRPPPGPGRQRRLNPGEEHALLRAASDLGDPRVGWAIRIALETAMRQGEILGLRLADVDLRQRVALLPTTKNGHARTVPLTRAAVETLTEAMASPRRRAGSAFIFCGQPPGDRALSQCRFWTAWDAVRSEAGLVDFRFHDLRHEAISRLVEVGLSDQEVATISGHRSMQMLKRYTHLRAQDLVARLDRLLGGRDSLVSSAPMPT
ncbi:MAG TPA: site-specific integrase [Xanthomonadaceae bacterium]|jgi:integrase